MRIVRCLLILAIALPAFGPSSGQAQPVPGDRCRYFRETGHYVCDEFLAFYETRGQLEIFGYPLSRAFQDPARNGLRVQYFQRARMEWHPRNPIPYQVQLGLLIDELGYRYPPVTPDQIPAPDDPAHHYFPETQHVVSYAFLDTFREKGGLDIFGYPRSEFIYEDGKVVQYFQRARMEWDRKSAGQPIRLANVGEMALERGEIPRRARMPVTEYPPEGPPTTGRGNTFLPLVIADARPSLSPAMVEPPTPLPTATPTAPPTAAPATPLPPSPVATAPVGELSVSASVRYPITGRTGTQTVFIYATDQERRPIAGATAQVLIHYPWGDQACTPRPTDNAGFTWCSFEIRSPTPGEAVRVDVQVTYDGLTGEAETTFMPWW